MHRIEPLSKAHDRERFDCGSEPLNIFLKQTARQHAERGISRTFVLVAEREVCPRQIIGFFSLNICQIQTETLTSAESKKLPRAVSAVRLGRLAVAIAFQKQGIGKTLIGAAMAKFLEIFELAGGIGLFVDAKDEQAKRYYEKFGFISMPSDSLEMFLPVRSIQELFAK